jgi:hypothetical protein
MPTLLRAKGTATTLYSFLYLPFLINRVLFRAWFGPLAQLVEHRTFNPMVPRSSRGRPTKFKPSFCIIFRRFKLVLEFSNNRLTAVREAV